jgi:hypothetical protein
MHLDIKVDCSYVHTIKVYGFYKGEEELSMNRILTAFLLALCMLCLTPGISMAATGGPDAFGYQYIDSSEPGGPVFYWVDIHATGTSAGLHNVDDVSSGALSSDLGFPFYGSIYSTFYVNSNGLITFGGGDNDYTNICLPSADAPDTGHTLPMIAVYWDDLVTYPAGSDVYYEYFDSSPHPEFSGPCLVVMWYNVQHYSGGGPQFSIEALLFADGNILMQYGPGNPEQGTGSTVGIQNTDGTIGLEYFCEGGADPDFDGMNTKSKSDKALVPLSVGPVPDNLAILFGPPVVVDDEKPVTEDVYTKYGKYTKNPKDKKFLENCFITAAAGEASGLFPMLMALACALGGLIGRRRG